VWWQYIIIAGHQLGLRAAGELETAEREITHAALIFLKESPVPSGFRR
jgi:hypothetical protein